MNSQSSWPFFTREEVDKVSSVLLSNKVNYWTGKECRKFEKEFAAWSESEYAVALANGTLALEVALKVLDISHKSEVIVTSRTFIASVSSIVSVGASPVFADVDLSSQNITPDSIRSAITSRTKAIVCVHLAGWPCDMSEIMAIANEHNLYVIEDCAQAHGAKYKERSVGSIGHIGCWSFCQDKIITTGGEGGMITTSDESLWQKIWSYKDHGKSYQAAHKEGMLNRFRWLHESFGSNYRMTEIQAAIGRIQLRNMKDWHKKRLENANKIWNTARRSKGLRAPEIPECVEHAAYKCYIFVKPNQLKHNWDRDRIIDEINALGVPCYSGSCSEVYLEKAFDGTDFKPKKRLNNARRLGETSLMFLVHPTLTEQELQKTCDALTLVMDRSVVDNNA